MTHRTEPGELDLRMSGEGLRPSTLPAAELGKLLRLLVKAVKATDPARMEGSEVLSLLSIEEGSAFLNFSIAPVAIAAVLTIGEALASGDMRQLPSESRRWLHGLSKMATRNGWRLELQAGRGLDIAGTAEISAERPVPAPRSRRLRGETSVRGRLERVGGAKPKGELRLEPEGTLLFFNVSADLAKRLGECLYRTVGLRGLAEWDSTGSIVRFEAKEVTGYDPDGTDLIEAFRELARLSGHIWDDVDPDAYVRRLRGEGET